MTDMVNHPPHYNKGAIQFIEAAKSMCSREEFKGFCKASALKYIWREDHKDANIEDLYKAIWYLKQCIKHLEEL